MRFRGKQRRIRDSAHLRRRFGRFVPAALLASTLSLGGCWSDASDSIAVLQPVFGAGTVRLRVALAPGYVEGSLEISLDGELIAPAFAFEGGIAKAEVPVAEGGHELSVRARFASDGRRGRGEQRLRFSPPPALPTLRTSEPAAASVAVPVSSWFRLIFSAPTDASARSSVELRCGVERVPLVVHAPTPETLIVNPARDLPGRSACALAWRARGGPQAIAFATAPSGPPASVLYDRSSAAGTAPFPDDFWLGPDPGSPGRQRLRISMRGFREPDRLLVDAMLSATRQLDGFSPIAHITIGLSEAADPRSLPGSVADSLDPMASVGLFDLTPGSPAFGRRVPFRLEARSSPVWGRESHALLLFPSVALDSGGRYGVVVTRRVATHDGRSFKASPFFARVRDEAGSPSDPRPVRRARRISGQVLDAIAREADPPITRDDVALALRITIRSTDELPNDLIAIRQDVDDGPPPRIEITRVEPEAAEERARGSAIAAVVHGTWEAPDWREHRLTFRRDPETGRPQRVATQALGFVLALPEAAREGPVPLVMYQHGNPGSAEEEVVPHARQSLARAGFAVIGFTDALNRDGVRPDMSESDRAFHQIVRIMWHVMLLQTIPDYFAQTNGEQLAFLRAIDEIAKLPTFKLVGDAEGERVSLFGIDADAALTYVGVSEGANLAPPFLAFAPEIRAAALIAGGRRFSEVLIHQEPETLMAPFADLGFSELGGTDIWVLLSLFQTIFDPQDGYLFAPYLYRRPFEVAGTTRRASVLLSAGLDDAAIPNHVTEALARELGPIPQLLPADRPVPLLPGVEAPVVANIDEQTTAAFVQFVPQGVPGVPPTPGCSSPPLSARSAREGHYCVQNAAEALLQRLVFLESALEKAAPVIVNTVIR
jgi:hypothetical protein